MLFMDKPIPTYYARVVVPTNGEAGWFYFEFHGASTSTRQRTLERLLSEYDNPSKQQVHPEIFHPWTAVDWHGTETTGVEINKLLEDQAAAIRALIQNIERRRRTKLSGMRIPITVVVRDGFDPLPRIPPVCEVIVQ